MGPRERSRRTEAQRGPRGVRGQAYSLGESREGRTWTSMARAQPEGGGEGEGSGPLEAATEEEDEREEGLD